ncbi:TRAP transporter small permease subunit [Pseudooceanicola sp. 502str34]
MTGTNLAPSPALRAATGLRRIVDKIAAFMNIVAGWIFVACAAFICLDVLARSAFNVSSAATVELSGYMLACGISWALAHTLSERAHVRVDVLVNNAPIPLQAYLHVFAIALLLAFSSFMTWAGYSLVAESLLFQAHDTSALYTPLAIPQTIWVIGLGGLTVMCAALLIEALLLLLAGRLIDVVDLLHNRTIDDEAQEALEAVSSSSTSGKDAS